MSDDTQDSLLRHARRLAIIKAEEARIKAEYAAAQQAATPDFAAARNRGITQQEVVLPDGSRAGLISIYGGGNDVRVDEDELLLHIALTEPDEVEEYLLPGAERELRVIELISEHFPELVGRRINAERRAQLQAELEGNDGQVADITNGELVKVATITPLLATGHFRYNPDQHAGKLISAALDAGTLTRSGETTQPATPAEDTAAPAGAAKPKRGTGRRRTAAVVNKADGPAQSPAGEQQAAGDGKELPAGES
jgi:hypothetical protein